MAHQNLLPELRRAFDEAKPELRGRVAQLIEHLEDPKRLEESFAQYLQPDGTVVVPVDPEEEEVMRMGVPAPRTVNEILVAHDILARLLSNEELAHELLPPPVYVRVAASADVLCWILHHDTNPVFADLVADVEARLRRSLMKEPEK